jgi:sugar lactone lactonase YvrE
MRVQLFNADGRYLKSWTDLGYPYALSFDADRNLWLADGGYDRILKLNRDGKILGTFGEPGRAPGQLAWAHGIAVGPDGKIFVAEVLSWRVQVFRPTTDKPSRAKYIPTSRMFFDHHPSNGWLNTQLK